MNIRTSERLIAQTLGGSPLAVLQPIDLATVRNVLRFPPETEDVLLEGWIAAATQYFGDATGRGTIAADWTFTLEAFPVGPVIELPRAPVLAVTSVTSSGGTLSSSAYRVVGAAADDSPSLVRDPFAGRARLELRQGSTWPSASDVVITYTVGYGQTAEDIPEIVKAVLYDLVRYFHMRPDAEELPMSTQVALRMFRQSAPNIYPLEVRA